MRIWKNHHFFLIFPKTKRKAIPIKNNIPPTIEPTKTKIKKATPKLKSTVGSNV